MHFSCLFIFNRCRIVNILLLSVPSRPLGLHRWLSPNNEGQHIEELCSYVCFYSPAVFSSDAPISFSISSIGFGGGVVARV